MSMGAAGCSLNLALASCPPPWLARPLPTWSLAHLCTLACSLPSYTQPNAYHTKSLPFVNSPVATARARSLRRPARRPSRATLTKDHQRWRSTGMRPLSVLALLAGQAAGAEQHGTVCPAMQCAQHACQAGPLHKGCKPVDRSQSPEHALQCSMPACVGSMLCMLACGGLP